MMGKHKVDMLPTSLPSIVSNMLHIPLKKRGNVEAKRFLLYTDTSTWTYIVVAHLRSCTHYTTEHYRCTAIVHNNLSCHQSCCCLSNRTEMRCTANKSMTKRHPNTCNSNTNTCFSHKYNRNRQLILRTCQKRHCRKLQFYKFSSWVIL